MCPPGPFSSTASFNAHQVPEAGPADLAWVQFGSVVVER